MTEGERRELWLKRSREYREQATIHASAAVQWHSIAVRDAEDPSLYHALSDSQSELADVCARWAREFADRAAPAEPISVGPVPEGDV